jgi:hypothetical protein
MADQFHPIPPTPTELPKVIWRLIQPVFDRYGVTFQRAFAAAQAKGPMIICWLTSRTPGGKTGEVYKPRLRATTVSSDGNHIVEYWGRGFTCTYQFEVVSHIADEADRLADNLEEMLEVITPDLQRLGVQEWYFLDQSGPRIIESTREQLYVHSFTYQAIMDRVTRKVLPMIRSVDVKLGTLDRIIADVPITRGNGREDLLVDSSGNPIRNVLKVIYASDETGLWNKYGGIDGTDIPLEARIYVPGVDFVPDFRDGLQNTVLIWTDVGRSPATGSVYYVTLSVLNA